jgi:rSAM/selenodomain-associated transferase 2
MELSIIIPTLNEEGKIGPCLRGVRDALGQEGSEILVIDGGSNDATVQEAKEAGADRTIRSPEKGRAVQMNHGASRSSGELLYFLHADACPPENFDRRIDEAYRAGYGAGTFRFRFDPMKPWLLWINSFMTRFPWSFVQGGDRSLFVERELFEEIGGFDESRVIMEDFEILERIRPRTPFRIIPDDVRVSSRKYRTNGYFKVQYANWRAMRLYKSGAPSERIREEYKQLLNDW